MSERVSPVSGISTDLSVSLPTVQARQRHGLLQSPSQLAAAWGRFRRHKLALAGCMVILVLTVASVFASTVAPHDPELINMRQRFAPPLTPGYLLGSDELGRDLFTRLLYASRISLFVGFSAMAITVLFGTLLEAIAGQFGGLVDSLLMRFTDTVMCFPTVFLLLALATLVGSTVFSIALIIAATAWMQITRIVHAQTLSLKEQDFVLAARAMGASDWRIIFVHLLPNTVGSVVVAGTFTIALAILSESYISYLGYGIQPPTPSWGNMLNNAQSYFDTAPWLAIFPGVIITLTVTGFNFLGDGLRDALDPRTQLD